jgi:hypothetical protein
MQAPSPTPQTTRSPRLVAAAEPQRHECRGRRAASRALTGSASRSPASVSRLPAVATRTLARATMGRAPTRAQRCLCAARARCPSTDPTPRTRDRDRCPRVLVHRAIGRDRARTRARARSPRGRVAAPRGAGAPTAAAERIQLVRAQRVRARMGASSRVTAMAAAQLPRARGASVSAAVRQSCSLSKAPSTAAPR